MAIPVSIGDVVSICTLVVRLREDYKTAPIEARDLVADLDNLNSSLSQFQRDEGQDSLLNRCTNEKRLLLTGILDQVQDILKELQSIGKRYSSGDGSWSRVWDRINFPRAQIRALQARVHLQISLLDLFMTSLSSAALVRIEKVLRGIVQSQRGEYGVQLGPRPGIDGTWSVLLDAMEGSGIEREALSLHKAPIEQLVDALTEVDETATVFSMESETIVGPDDADAFHPRQAVVGPPTKEHIVSSLCAGAVMWQDGTEAGVRQSWGVGG